MPARTNVPAPLRAGIGLLATGVEKARDLPRGLTGLPIRAAAGVLRTVAAAQEAYDELARRGEQVVTGGRRTPAAAQARPGPKPAAEPPSAVPRFEPSDEVAVVAGEVPERGDLPLADYDHMTLGSLRARLPRLDAVALMQIREYERAHANRLPVLTMIENRLAKIGAGDLVTGR